MYTQNLEFEESVKWKRERMWLVKIVVKMYTDDRWANNLLQGHLGDKQMVFW